ncbi:Cas10/Cmr2 second palm domain-containing protein [Metallosphaera hakonensis]|uniref:Cas10/Cmr2 second palm domain-containing protein n=1 Tax=Metallosphaera hakonensis TaxID=79601 RepID=UPI00209219A5|nr:hypothetical protein [Metallosphaera hakonensis]
MGITDGDKVGEVVTRLSAFPGRLMTFSSLMDFTFAHIVTSKVNEELKGKDNVPIVVLYSGGDDLAVYGKWDDVFDLLVDLSDLIVRILPSISVSGGLLVFKKKFPIAFAYSFAKEQEDVAKKERNETGGRISSNIFEKYTETQVNPCKKPNMTSLTWDEARRFLMYAEELSKTDLPNAYLYKLHHIGQMIEECEIPGALVSYAYLNARNEQVFNRIEKVTEGYLLKYPGEREQEVVARLLKFRDVINMYSLLARTQS